MKDNKKHVGLLLSLLCLFFCGALLLTACKPGKTDPTTEPPTVADTTEAPAEETTAGDTTEPEEEATTEETEPETTEEPTEAPGGSSSGVGGGYTPQPSEPTATEPEEETTEPEIQVSAAGSENNPYYENISTLPGSFSTVKIPAKSEMYYIVKSAGAFLRVEAADVSVVYNGQTYSSTEGVLQLQLPGGSESTSAVLQFVNNGTQEQSFPVQILAEVGASSNPIVLEAISQLEVKLDKDDADGLHYSWTADKSGVLTLGVSSVQPAAAGADIVVTAGEKTVKLSDSNGLIQIPVNAGDPVLIQVIALADGGSYPAIQAVINGSIVPVAELKAESIPQTLSTDVLAPGETVYYNIFGVNGTLLQIRDEDVSVVCGGKAYAADENGMITIAIAPGSEDQAVQLEIHNGGASAKKFQLQFVYPEGHGENPQVLTELGELKTQVQAGTDGYHYQYIATASGAVSFRVQTQPDVLGVRTNIVVQNLQTQQEASLWKEDANGSLTQQEAATVDVTQGDVIAVCVQVMGMASDSCVDASLTVFGALNSTQTVEFPGFTAQIAAGQTAYYEGYNLEGTIFCLTGENVAVTHDGVTYIPKDGQILFRVVAESRMPAKFVIENRGEADGAFPVTFSYSVGHRMNPDQLALGSSFVNQAAGADEYCFNYTAPKSGELVLTFDADADWCYTVDNLTKQLYGEICFSDSETAVDTAVVTVAEGDEIQLRVNTYDPDAPWNTPEGSVSFAATLVTGPVEISDLSEPFAATLLAGETVEYTGALQGMMLTIENAQNATLCYEGEYYEANAEGVLNLSFLKPNGSENAFSFTLQNRAAEDWSCTMTLSAIAGGPLNPGQMLLGVSAVNNPEGAAGYWFSYTAPKAGDLILTFDQDASWSYAIGSGANQNSDTAAPEVTVPVTAGEQIVIWVNTYDPEKPQTAPAGAVSFEATLVSGPVQIEDISAPFQTTLLAGETVTYAGKLHGATVSIANAQNATLSYNGQYYEANEEGILSVAFLEPNVLGELEFALHNRATEDWNCAMTFTVIPGGPQAPGEMKLGTSSVSSGEDSTGYWFCYDAPKTGVLTLTFDQEADWRYAVNGGEMFFSDSEPAANVAQIPVRSGEQVIIWVSTYDPENPDSVPAGTVEFKAELLVGPIELTDLKQGHEELLRMGETALFTGDLRNTIVTIANADYLLVNYNGQDYTANEVGTVVLTFLEPDSNGQWQFTVRNLSSTDQPCPMQFNGLKGNRLNPETMVLGENTVQLEEGAAEYCFGYTAPKSGQLVLSFDESANWSYRVNDGEKVFSDSEPAANVAQVEVKAGDEILVHVSTYDPAATDTVPAGTVTFHASLISDQATITNLTQPFAAELLAWETAQYFGFFKDAVITIADAEEITANYGDSVYTANEEGIITFAFDDVLWEFSLINNSDENASCTMTFTGEAGTWINPAVMVLGTNTANREANADEYYLSYHAPKTGELVLTFNSAASWSYAINDGEMQSGIAAAADTVWITVEDGDDVDIRVNTYDQAAPETVPAGTVEFTATLITGPVTVSNTEQPMLNMLAGETVKVSGVLGGEKLTIEDAEYVTVSYAGTAYTADAEGVVTLTFPETEEETLEFTVHNGAAEDVAYILIFGDEKGTRSNPDVLVVGKNTAACKAGSNGYYFTFTATRDCQIRLTFDKQSQWAFEWQYGSGNSDKASTSWRFRSGKILAGETITVLIKTYDPENPDVLPDGTVEFDLDIPTYY